MRKKRPLRKFDANASFEVWSTASDVIFREESEFEVKMPETVKTMILQNSIFSKTSKIRNFVKMNNFELFKSGSVKSSSIYLTDTPKVVREKIFKFAFSGGQETVEEQREKGADLNVDVAYQYLTFFLDDDEKLKDIAEKYSSGKMMTSEVKEELVNVLTKIVLEHQKRRASATEDVVKAFMSVRELEIRTKKESPGPETKDAK